MNRPTSSVLAAFRKLTISPSATLRPCPNSTRNGALRTFTTTTARQGNWLEPKIDRTKKKMKGRPRVATGGSIKGTTVQVGDWGLRMKDHDRRISAKQLKVAETTIKTRLRGQRYRLYHRVNCNIGVYTSGNEMRMGKGKGSFDHWAARVAVSRVLFEIKGDLHEQVVKDAFRLAGNKLPGQYEFIRKGAAPVLGITKLENGVTIEALKRPWKTLPAAEKPETTPAVMTTPDVIASPGSAPPSS